MLRIAPTIVLEAHQANELRRRVRASPSSVASVTCSRIIFLAAEGDTNQEIADALEIPEQMVAKWRRRFSKLGMPGLLDSRRSGQPMRLSPESINRVLTEVAKPPANRSQ